MVYWINLGACVSSQEDASQALTWRTHLGAYASPGLSSPGNLLSALHALLLESVLIVAPPYGPSVSPGLRSALFLMVSCNPALRRRSGFFLAHCKKPWAVLCFPPRSQPLSSPEVLQAYQVPVACPTHASGGGRKVFSLLSWVSLNFRQVLCPVSLVSGMEPLSNHPLPRRMACLIF